MVLTIFYHKCMGKDVILEGKSEYRIEIIRHIILSEVMEMKKFILKIENKEMIIVLGSSLYFFYSCKSQKGYS